jgi:hypothetical protein
MENREMFNEINALVGAVGKALDISEIEVITAIEQGRLCMEMAVDDVGRNFVEVTLDERKARVYQGAIFRPDDSAPAEAAPAPAPESDDDGSCGGGCSCGH